MFLIIQHQASVRVNETTSFYFTAYKHMLSGSPFSYQKCTESLLYFYKLTPMNKLVLSGLLNIVVLMKQMWSSWLRCLIIKLQVKPHFDLSSWNFMKQQTTCQWTFTILILLYCCYRNFSTT